jgi:hypothetical protein
VNWVWCKFDVRFCKFDVRFSSLQQNYRGYLDILLVKIIVTAKIRSIWNWIIVFKVFFLVKLTNVKARFYCIGRPINTSQFSLEFLKSLKFSGMPPLALKLVIRWRFCSVDKDLTSFLGNVKWNAINIRRDIW